jgi:DNA-binding transcriptional MerR regulator
MLYWVIQVIFFSILFILLIHHILHFLKTNLTVPKVKDLVNTRNQKYEDIFRIVSNSNNRTGGNNNSNIGEPEYKIEDLLPKQEYKIEDLLPKQEASMKNELKNFLKEQLNSDTTDISTLDNIAVTNSYVPL